MVVGLGIDIVSKRRIKKLLELHGEKFLNRLFAEEEMKRSGLEQMASQAKKGATNLAVINERIFSYVAKRFAAKEAVSKAIGCGIGAQLSLKDIRVYKNEKGSPFLEINEQITRATSQNQSIVSAMAVGDSVESAFKNGRLKFSVSISDEKDNAVCMVIMEYIRPK